MKGIQKNFKPKGMLNRENSPMTFFSNPFSVSQIERVFPRRERGTALANPIKNKLI
jgi:hypothetical protein